MPLQKLNFKPGVNREATSLAAEGEWFECDKIRFRSGYPEKIGGWEVDSGSYAAAYAPPAGSFWGVARSLWNWVALSGANLLGIGTNLKYMVQDGSGGIVYDVTPIRNTTAAGDVTFAATTGSAVITVSDTAHDSTVGDFVTYSGAVSLGGDVTADILNAEHQVATVIDNDTYTITVSVTATASDTGDGGASVVAAYQLSVGQAITESVSGWGSGTWGGVAASGDTGWGESVSDGGVVVNARLWSNNNYGQNLIINPRYGGLYMWIPSGTPGVYNRAVRLASTSSGLYQTDADCPEVCTSVLVSDASRIVLAFGCNDYGSSVLDPLLIRWSAQEDYTTWTPSATNQAGSYRLSHGSEISSVLQTRQEILVWTDAALYSMQYVGPPYIWTTALLADNTSIMSPNAATTANGVAFWMGVDKFYTYNGQVQTLPCTLRQFVFNNINIEQKAQFFAGTNEGFNEIWWFYCSANSEVVDRYVIFNYLENTWAYGTLARTAWLDSPLRGYPTAAGYNGQIIYHENGVNDGTTNPPSAIDSYIQSADFNIGDGHNYGFAWRVVPDVTFDGSSSAAPEVTITLRPRQNPGSAYGTAPTMDVVSANNYSAQRTYLVQQFTEIVYTRVRGRQMAFKIGSNSVGTQWQLGAPTVDVRPDGRR